MVAFFVGAASLGAEIAAARLLAPYFGASTIIWANTIATVLVALSAGYAVGGRLADRRADLRGLCAIVLGAAVLLAIVPFVSDPFLNEAVKALGALSIGGFLGSLAAVLVLVAVPVLLLGMVAPYVESPGGRSRRRHRDRHRAAVLDLDRGVAGRHLPGRAAADPADRDPPHVPGVRADARDRGRAGRGSWRFLVVAAVIAALLAVPPAAIGADVAGARVIYSTETQYQYARVLQFPSGERWLELNEGVAVHSVYRPWSYLTGGYWDDFLVLPFAAAPVAPRRIAILGDAAGTVARAYGHYFPDTRVDAVEIDGALTSIGWRYFGLSGPRPAPVHGRRPALARVQPRPLRRDLPRRLPPAVHPVLPGHSRVLCADPRSPEPGRDRDRQRRARSGLGRAREGRLGDAARGVPGGRARRVNDTNSLVVASAPPLSFANLAVPAPLRPLARTGRPARLGRRCAVAPCTPTTRLPSNG